jgi:hypothetical protein
MPIIKINDAVYGNKITFIRDEADVKVIKYLKANANYDATERIKVSNGFFLKVDYWNYCIVIVDGCVNWLGTLVHECMHVTSRVLRDRDLPLSNKSEEAYTHYLTWLFNACALRAVKKSRRKKLR